MRIVIASFAGMPPEFRDDEVLLDLLRARGVAAESHPWSDRSVAWDSYDLVVARTPWDYTFHHAQFCEWVRRVRAPLENDPELIVWNSDKRYLGDLAAAGVPTVETAYVGPGEPAPPIEGEVVVKPTVSAGARDTGRFGPGSAREGRRLVEKITAAGRTAMVQPFVRSVDSDGETAVVLIDGEISHVLRKRSVLRPDEVAPLRDDALAAAEAMYDPDLVQAGEARDDERALAVQVLATIREMFATTPLYARVDMVREAAGEPVLLELEAIEPNLYFEHAPGSAIRLAEAIIRRAAARG